MIPATFAFERYETSDVDLYCLVHSAEAIRQAEWDHVIETYRAYDRKMMRDLSRFAVLAITDGVGPDATMRSQLSDFLDGRVVRTTIITGSKVVRGIVTAVSWFNPEVRVYPAEKFEAGLAHLRIAPGDRRSVLAFVAAMKDRVRAGATLATLAGGV